MKHSLRQLDELDSRICMRHIMKHNLCLNLCLIEIRKSNFFTVLPHFVLHVNSRVQLFPHSEDFEAQCEAAEIRESNCDTPGVSHTARLFIFLMAVPISSLSTWLISIEKVRHE